MCPCNLIVAYKVGKSRASSWYNKGRVDARSMLYDRPNAPVYVPPQMLAGKAPGNRSFKNAVKKVAARLREGRKYCKV
jgi:hypothetical protein